MHKLSWLLDNLQEGQIARADYAEDGHWHITKLYGFFWYCDEEGNISGNDKVVLASSDVRAWYEVVGQRREE